MNYIFIGLALLAEIIGTIGGFGSSVFFVPIGNFYFDFHTVLGLTAIFHVSSNLTKIFFFRQGLDKKLIINIGIPAVAFVIIGGVLSKHLQTSYLEFALAFFLVAISLLFLLKPALKLFPNLRNSILGGALSGFAAGLLGTGGAIRGLTMAAFDLKKSMFIATSAFIDLAVDTSRTVVYYQNGYIGKEELQYLPYLIGIAIVGTYLGKLILNHISQKRFKAISLILVLIIGLVTLFKAFSEYQS